MSIDAHEPWVSTGASDAAAELFSGPGEHLALCRALNWGATPIGPVDRWPTSLRTATRLCLDAPFPMSVWAGPQLVLVYNELFTPVLGPEGHPWALGRPAHEVWADVWDWLGPEVEPAMLRGVSSRRENRRFVTEQDGRDYDVFFTYSFTPIREADGRVVGVINLFQETTEIVHVERDLRRVFELSRELVAVLGSGGRFRRVNPAFTRVLGWSEEELISHPGTVFTHPEDRDRTIAQLRDLAGEHATAQFDTRLRHKDGSYRRVSWTAVSVPEERIIYAVGRDVTEHWEAEQALRESDRLKTEYLAMLGHELRNPLAAIRSATELMTLAIDSDPRLLRAARVLERQSSHVLRIIDDLLDVSRIARGKVHLALETLDLRAVVQHVLEDRSAQIATHGLQLHPQLGDEPIWVAGDTVRLAQVFDNLLGNAIKFTEPAGSIGVALAREGAQAVVRVRDTGVGIRPDMLPQIFDTFRQGTQDLARSSGGLGLGLSLARGLVELHGGTICAHSAGLGAGAELEVRLPLADAPSVRERDAVERDATAMRILLVEDNVDAAEMLRELLQLRGHDVSVAGQGRDALKLLEEEPYDIVLCDLGLPDISGHDLARTIHRDAAHRNLPLVAITGYGQPADRERSRAAGFCEHLVKPVDLRALDDVLRRRARAA
jgi:PAS domain S-box-containing protein